MGFVTDLRRGRWGWSLGCRWIVFLGKVRPSGRGSRPLSELACGSCGAQLCAAVTSDCRCFVNNCVSMRTKMVICAIYFPALTASSMLFAGFGSPWGKKWAKNRQIQITSEFSSNTDPDPLTDSCTSHDWKRARFGLVYSLVLFSVIFLKYGSLTATVWQDTQGSCLKGYLSYKVIYYTVIPVSWVLHGLTDNKAFISFCFHFLLLLLLLMLINYSALVVSKARFSSHQGSVLLLNMRIIIYILYFTVLVVLSC